MPATRFLGEAEWYFFQSSRRPERSIW